MSDIKVSRRALVGGGTAVAGVAAGLAVGDRYAERGGDDATTSVAATYPFRGTHQAGIVTPAQDRLHFAAFDITTGSRAQLVALLKAWTTAAERMTQGLPAGPIGPTEGAPLAPPDDTGEAIGLPPGGLTITFGFGPGMFRDARRPRPLRARRPAAGGARRPAALPG